jgi:putative endonuclease
MPAWYVYVIECTDGSLYTGIATDVDRRYAEHAAGKGARYTRAHPPRRLLARFAHPDRAAACRAEYAIKQLSPARKRALCAGATALPAPIRSPTSPQPEEAHAMSRKFKVGDHVRWNSEAGHVTGRITKVHTRDTQYKGHTRHCSPEDPQYEIESDKTDHVAMHKGSALEKIAD